ncbi:MAG: MFS transporter [Chloroflexi bacterium]|nr:MFS transporter [Chloroflexota bacterium]
MAGRAPSDDSTPTFKPLPRLPTRFKNHVVYYGWYIVLVAFLGSMMGTGIQVYSLGVFLKPMTEELGWTRTDISLGQTISTLCSGVVAFWVGPLLDKHGGRVLMVVGAIAMGAGFVALGFVQELWHYYLVKGVLVTAGSAMAGLMVLNVALSNWFVRRRGIAIGVSAMGVSLAALTMPLISTVLIEAYGWRATWAILGVTIPAVIVPLSLFVLRRRPEDHGLLPDGGPGNGAPVSKARAASMAMQSVVWTRRQAMQTRSLWMLIATFSLGSVGLSALFLHMIPYLSDSGLSATQAASVFGMVGLSGLISKPLWGLALDRFNTSYCAASEFLLMGAGLSAIILIDNVWGLHLAVFLLGLGIGGVSTVQEVIWADYFGRATIGTIRGLSRPFTVIASAGGPVFAGLAYDMRGSYELAFTIFIATYVCAAIMILLTPYPTAPKPDIPPDGGPVLAEAAPVPLPAPAPRG